MPDPKITACLVRLVAALLTIAGLTPPAASQCGPVTLGRWQPQSGFLNFGMGVGFVGPDVCVGLTPLVSILDASDPSQPEETAHIPDVWGVAIATSESHAFIVGAPFDPDTFERDDTLRLFVLDPGIGGPPAIVGELDLALPFASLRVAWAADKLFLAVGRELIAIDTSDPTSPIVSGTLDLPGDALAIGVRDDLGAIGLRGDGTSRLMLFDPTDPAAMSSIATTELDPSTFVTDIAIGDGAIYLGDTDALFTVDARDPSRPVVTAVTRRATAAWFVRTAGSALVVVGGFGSYEVFTLADPLNPAKVAQGAAAGDVVGIGVRGATVALIQDDAGSFDVVPGTIDFLDVSDPIDPPLITRFSPPSCGEAVDVDGSLVALVGRCQSTGLLLLDATEVGQLRVTGQIPLEAAGDPRDVAIAGDIVCLAGEGGLTTVDIADPTDPRVLRAGTADGSASLVAAEGSLALIAIGSEVIASDITDPAAPMELWRLPLPAAAGALLIDGSIAYIGTNADPATGDASLTVVDVSQPDSPLILATASINASIRDIAIDGTRLYLAAGGIAWYDIAVPAFPVLLGRIVDPGVPVSGLSVGGGVLAAHGLNVDVSLFEIDALGQPVLAGTLDVRFGATSGDVVVAGGLAFVAGDPYALMVVDTSDATAPAIVGAVVSGTGGELEVSGGLLLGTPNNDDAFDGLWIADIADPANPRLRGMLRGPADIGGIVADRPRAAASLPDGTVVLIDLTDPDRPTLAGTIGPAGPIGALEIDGRTLYRVTLPTDDGEPARLAAYDILDLDEPMPITERAVPGAPRAFHARLGLGVLVCATPEPSLSTYDLSSPDEIRPLAEGVILDTGVPVLTSSGPSLEVADGLAVVGWQDDFLFRLSQTLLVDVSDPTDPRLLSDLAGSIDRSGPASLGGGLLASTSIFGPTSIFDLRVPGAPRLLGDSSNVGGDRVRLVGDALLVARGQGIGVLDISRCRPCAVDFSAPYGVLDTSDLVLFTHAVIERLPSADLDSSGVIDLFDLLLFFNLFDDGC